MKKTKKTKKTSKKKAVKKIKKIEPPKIPRIAKWWWVAPVFLGFIGGILAWRFNKDKNYEKARLLLVFGVVITVLFTFLVLASTGILSGLMTQYTMENLPKEQFCTMSHLEIQKAYYDVGSEYMTLYLYNNGEVALEGFVVEVAYPGRSTSIREFNGLRVNRNDLELAILRVEGDVESAEVYSMECEETKDVIERNEILGLVA